MSLQCQQNFYFGSYIVRYTVGNEISDCISDDLPPQMKILNMVIPILMHFFSFFYQTGALERYMPHKTACHPRKCYVINDAKLFRTVYRKFLTLSNQTTHITKASILECMTVILPRDSSFCLQIHNRFSYLKITLASTLNLSQGLADN